MSKSIVHLCSWVSGVLAVAACGGETLTRGVATESLLVEVKIAPVQMGTLTEELSLPANVLPRRRSIIVSEVEGVIESLPRPRENIEATPQQIRDLLGLGVDIEIDPLNLDIGDEVRKGQVLVRLIPRDFELAVAVAAAELNAAEADLAELHAWKRPEEMQRLQAARREAEADLEQARTELERARSLLENRIAAQAEFDLRLAAVKRFEARLDQASAELSVAEAGPTEAETAVSRARVTMARSHLDEAERSLGKTVIRAPYDAVVTDRYADVGDRVTQLPRFEILEIMDIRQVVVEVAVPDRFVNRVSLGDWARVQVKGLDAPVRGLVVLINEKVDHQTRTFRTRLLVDNRERVLKAGQFARATFRFTSTKPRPIVPARAVAYGGGQAHVFVFADGRVARRVVTPGMRDEERIEIVQGVEVGELVVVDDPSLVADGMRVEVRSGGPGR